MLIFIIQIFCKIPDGRNILFARGEFIVNFFRRYDCCLPSTVALTMIGKSLRLLPERRIRYNNKVRCL
jgi:hypothetical protein